MMQFFSKHSGKILFLAVFTFAIFLLAMMFEAPVSGFENKLIYLLKQYGYLILFAWSILEGEMGLIMAGLLSHNEDMNLFLAIFVGGLGGFVGDQIYFYTGRYNKKYINGVLTSQKRKFALAHLLLKKYGWPIIFIQRYMYGMRTIIPISIGLTRYSSKQFALINFISALCWASITIIPVWYFGDVILKFLEHAKQYWYFVIPLFAGMLFGFAYYFNSMTKKKGRK